MRKQGISPPKVYEFRWKRQDGSIVWLENRVADITWQGGAANLFFTVEITERKLAAAAIERFVEALEFLPQGISLWDADQRRIHFNERYRDFLDPLGSDLAPSVELEEIHRKMAARGMIDAAVGREAEWRAERMTELAHPGHYSAANQ